MRYQPLGEVVPHPLSRGFQHGFKTKIVHRHLPATRSRDTRSIRGRMSVNSNIEWTDATWNPVRGCTKFSPGCKHCCAETFAERFRGVKGHPYEQGFDLRLVPKKLTEPFTWRSPKLVFVNSMMDILD